MIFSEEFRDEQGKLVSSLRRQVWSLFGHGGHNCKKKPPTFILLCVRKLTAAVIFSALKEIMKRHEFYAEMNVCIILTE